MCYFSKDERYFKKLWCLTVYVAKSQARLSKNTVITLRLDFSSTNFNYAQNSEFTRTRFNFVNALLKNLSKFRGQSKGKLLVNKIINYWVSPLGLFSSESVGNIFATVWLGFVCWVSWTLCVDASYERERAWFIQLWTKVLRHFNKTNAFHLKFRYLVLTLQWLFELSIIEFWKIAG